MKNNIRKIISMLLALVIFSVSSVGYSYASGMTSNLTKGHVIIINTKQNKLGYFKDGNVVKVFDVATGKTSTPTPTGKTIIVNKIKNRPYYSGGIAGGDPKNPLGDRWLGLNLNGTFGTTYAIHGNNDESSIGKFVSGGCIRMHNSEVRWLYDVVPIGTTVIIEKSDKTFTEIAAKYSIRLNEVTQNMENVQSKFKQFYIYGSMSNPTIDLSNKNSLITKSSDATNILKKTVNGTKYDRQKFLDEWNKLTSYEKTYSSMVKIQNEYKNIITVVEAAEATLKFYENVKSNANTLINNKSAAVSLNSKTNMSLGARGSAYKEYNEAAKNGENSSNSPRMKYINEKYIDAVSFLNVAQYIGNNDLNKAKTEVSKIKDSTLKNIANEKINAANKKEVVAKYEQFYIYGPSSNPILNLTNKNELITKSSDATNILRKTVDGKKYDRQLFLDAWNKLTASEKKDSDMQSIQSEYKNIITVVEAAEANLKFFENIKTNAKSIINNASKAAALNSKTNMDMGARGKAYKEYTEASKNGENRSNSARMKYINEKYLDAISFLNVAEYLGQKNIDKANEGLGKIKDETLRSIASEAINNIQ